MRSPLGVGVIAAALTGSCGNNVAVNGFAFTSPRGSVGTTTTSTSSTTTKLYQSAPPAESKSGRSSEEKLRELGLGSNLNANGSSSGSSASGSDPTALSVMDFGAVKDTSSKAEQALLTARVQYLESLNADMVHATPNLRRDHTGDDATSTTASSTTPVTATQTGTLMGINADVIAEVGHPVGAFVTDAAQVQECAAWLRSTAPAGLLETDEAPPMESYFDPAKTSQYKALLDKSYAESGEVTAAFAKTFYLGTQLMAEPARLAIWAVYVWCRRTDEIVDAPRPNPEDMLRDLSEWEIRLERLWQFGQVVDVLDLPLLDVRQSYPALEIQPFVDMIRGMLMDIPNLGQDRYETFDELHLYCYRVAGTVGLMSMPIFGCAPGCTDEQAKEPALSLGVAFQLTNILRDVGEDADRGRIYLPQEDLDNFGVSQQDILQKNVTPQYQQMMKYQIARARRYYVRAKRGVAMLREDARWPVQSSLDCYSQILDKIEENNHDSLSQRAYVSKWEKLATLPASWYRTLDIAQMLPLPGDGNGNGNEAGDNDSE